MATWTDPADVIDAWIGDNAPTDLEKVRVWVERAEREVRRRVPNLADRITADDEPDLIDTIRDVVTAMVTRVLRNPEGIRQYQETTGPFTKGSTYGGDMPGGLALTKDEVAALRGQGNRPRAFEIDLAPTAGLEYVIWP